ncbi:alkaline phosphatase [Nocardioides panacisoli]|uniref:Alkaline phosphatase n=1 Tax=Nocardioides panacisoli TaxID=627624 RepID=A0ABP7IYT7_9ACTN
MPRSFGASQRARTLSLVTATLVAGGVLVTAGLASGDSDTPADLTLKGAARRLDGDQTASVRSEVRSGHPQNVILLIGDGMGDSEITVARNYAEGAAGHFDGIDELPMTGSYTTYALHKSGPYQGKPDYVTDSAASGTGWSTGTKTYNGAISENLSGVPQQTLLELAKVNGLKTGDVTTAEIQDATPAVQTAHVADRGCYQPGLNNGGTVTKGMNNCPNDTYSITEQQLQVRPDVLMGGGAKWFGASATTGEYAGQTLTAQAAARGFTTVTDQAGLDAVTEADQEHPLLGLFAPGNMPVRWTGPIAKHGGYADPPATCTDNPNRPAAQPSLAHMTQKAIDLLENPNGFFLQVEGASIDKQDHAADPCGQIGETVDLDEAVQVALDFAKQDGNTLVLLTADHGHSSQIINPEDINPASPATVPPGLTTTLMTADGAPMTISYGTADTGGSQQHTGTQVRLAGYGPYAANVVGLTDQTDLYFTMRDGLGLVDDPADASSDGAVTATPAKVRKGKKVTLNLTGFEGDRRASVKVTGPNGYSKTLDLQLTVGSASAQLPMKTLGKYKVKTTGAQTGVAASTSYTVVG